MAGTHSIVGDPAFYTFIDEGIYNGADYLGGYVLIHELFHGAAGSVGQYTHYDMARAAYNAAMANPALKKEVQRHGIKGPREGTPGKYVEVDDRYNASVFDSIVQLGCPKPAQ